MDGARLRQIIPVLHVTNAAASVAFYRDGLGFRVAWEAPAPGPERDPAYLQVERDDAVLHLSSHAGDAVVGGVAMILAEDVDALHREFVSRGVAIHVGPVDQTWGLRELYVRDPDGNTLRFATPLRR